MQSTFNSINQYVNKCAVFSENEIQLFDDLLQHKTVKKKTMLLREGEICNFEAYILKGCIRTFCMDENGAEVILQFAVEDWWVSDIASFHEQTPSKLYIETLENCELLILTHEAKEELLMKVPQFERVFRLMVQRNLSVTQNRLINIIAKPAQDRYVEFLERYPSVAQRVAQHYIAAYLGISAEFLSKIRAKMSTKR
ncbi:Crp/Fnr family transcriptional regulator [Arcicella sp. LKC2W]|uniref:Crp/Fnr family transcriptional regulator n=1 Tax=Arcicella sp. LKC2W TaxID=2984198 RepID=UPI002B20FDE2|nr:Crp/Fnr family transcriptional regulator [Arcicella sp. LKC2W]MEA5460093.1 Crp/Fnr family transcriptional regulator [Arcicella sp. LKC2W]